MELALGRTSSAEEKRGEFLKDQDELATLFISQPFLQWTCRLERKTVSMAQTGAGLM